MENSIMVLEGEVVERGGAVVPFRPQALKPTRMKREFSVIPAKPKRKVRHGIRTYTTADGRTVNQAVIRIKGKDTEYGNFDTFQEAKNWRENRASELRRGVNKQNNVPADLMLGGVVKNADGKMVPDPKCLLMQYRVEWEKENRVGMALEDRLAFDRLAKHPLLNVKVAGIDFNTIRVYCRQRKLEVQVSTVMSEITHLTAALDSMTAWKNWDNFFPMLGVRKRLKKEKLIGQNKHRERRPTDSELKSLLSYFKNQEENPKTDKLGRKEMRIPMVAIVQILDANAFRRGELMKLKWSDIDVASQSVWIWRKDKTGKLHSDGRHRARKRVPLVPAVLKLLLEQPRIEGEPRIFPYQSNTVQYRFWMACKKLGIEDLRMHDLRHDAISKLVMILDNSMTMAISGHETETSFGIYRNLKEKDALKISNKLADFALPLAA